MVVQLACGNSTIRTLPSCLWVLGSSPLTPHFSISQSVMRSPLSSAFRAPVPQ